MGRQFAQTVKGMPYLNLNKARSSHIVQSNRVPDMVTIGNHLVFNGTSIVKTNSAGAAVWTLAVTTAKADATKFYGTGYYDSATERLYILLWKSGSVAFAQINTATGAMVTASGAWLAVSGFTSAPDIFVGGSSTYKNATTFYMIVEANYTFSVNISTQNVTNTSAAELVPTHKLRIAYTTASGGSFSGKLNSSSKIGYTDYTEILIGGDSFANLVSGSICLVGEVAIGAGTSSLNTGFCFDITKLYDAIDDYLLQIGETSYTVWRRDEI